MTSFGDTISRETLERNLKQVRERIAYAATRNSRQPESVALIAVTKYFPGVNMLTLLHELGIAHIGESRVLDADRKFKELYAAHQKDKKSLDPTALNWHMIGHLQTNKSERAVRVFHTLHSVDSVRSAEAVNTEVNQLASGPRPALLRQILLQINVAREGSKYGLEPTVDDITALLKICSEFQHLNVVGLMTMTPLSDDPSKTYRQPLIELSMGMTQDYAIAVEEGSTMVRVGSALYQE
jgi:hypothetical protein